MVIRWFFLFLILASLVGCANEVSFSEANDTDFLSQPVVKLERYHNSFDALTIERLNDLLAIAYEAELFDTCLFLVEYGADGDVEVATKGSEDKQEILFIEAARRSDEPNQEALIRKIVLCAPYVLNRLVEYEPSSPGYKTSLFHTLAVYSDIDLFQFAVDGGGDVDLLNSVGNTPVFDSLKSSAVFPGSIYKNEIFLALIEHGAEISITNNYGSTPLHYFRWWPEDVDFSDTVSILIRETGVNVQDQEGDTPAHKIITSGTFLYQDSERYLQQLIENGADLSIRNRKGNNILDSFVLATAQYRKMAPEDMTEILKEQVKQIQVIDQMLRENL